MLGRRHPILTVVSFLGGAVLVTAYLGFQSCSRQGAAPREIRGHTRIISSVAHAEPVLLAERYCSHCHGEALQGGAALSGSGIEPSCYQCHGKNWTQEADQATVSRAPADHIEEKTLPESEGRHGVYRHGSALHTPESDCTACHGADLKGNIAFPGCVLCHEKLWEQ